MANHSLIIGALMLGMILLVATLSTSIATLVKISNHKNKEEKPSQPNKGNTTPVTLAPPNPTEPPTSATEAPPKEGNPINVHRPEVIKKGDSRYEAFSYYGEALASGLNLSKNPCDNFYEYICDNVPTQPMKDLSNSDIHKYIFSFETLPKFEAMNKLKVVFDQCKNKDDPNDSNGVNFNKLYNKFSADIGVPLPTVTKDRTFTKPSIKEHTTIIAALSEFGGNTLFGYEIEKYFSKRAENDYTHTVHFGDPALPFAPPEYEANKEEIAAQIQQLLLKFVISSKNEYDEDQLNQDAEDVLNFHLELQKINNKAAPEGFKNNNIYTSKDATRELGFIDYQAYLTRMFQAAEKQVQTRVTTDNFEINFNQPQVVKELSDYFNSEKVTARTVYLHHYVSFLVANQRMLASVEVQTSKLSLKSVNRQNLINTPKGGRYSTPVPLHKPTTVSLTTMDAKSINCALKIRGMNGFRMLIDRAYMDYAYPDKSKRTEVKAFVADFAEKIILGFQNQLNQINWFSTETKNKAYAKIFNLVRNIAFDDRIEDDEYLNNYYKNLDIKENYDENSVNKAIKKFEQQLTDYKLLSKEPGDQQDMHTPISIANAFYASHHNSINIPFGILDRPIFDTKFPISVIYGALGTIVGHEIVHGFDNNGVHWDDMGYLNMWMDKKAQKVFGSVEKCVVDQYNNIKIGGRNVDGKRTVGENIADNGGIRAAYNAYKSYTGLNGNDPALPNEKASSFSGDQLFFAAFARAFCTKDPPNFLDTHAPDPARILATFQNFPEFKTAFNCRTNERYAPSEHCNVWTPLTNF